MRISNLRGPTNQNFALLHTGGFSKWVIVTQFVLMDKRILRGLVCTFSDCSWWSSSWPAPGRKQSRQYHVTYDGVEVPLRLSMVDEMLGSPDVHHVIQIRFACFSGGRRARTHLGTDSRRRLAPSRMRSRLKCGSSRQKPRWSLYRLQWQSRTVRWYLQCQMRHRKNAWP